MTYILWQAEQEKQYNSALNFSFELSTEYTHKKKVYLAAEFKGRLMF